MKRQFDKSANHIARFNRSKALTALTACVTTVTGVFREDHTSLVNKK